MDDLLSWGEDLWDTGVEFFSDVDTYDFSDTSDYWSSDVGFDSDWSFDGIGNFWDENKGWMTPLAKAGYSAYQEGQAGDAYRAARKPWQDYMDKSIKQQSAYYDPSAVEAGVAQDLERKAGMLSSQYRGADMPRYSSAFNKGTLGSSTFNKQMASRDAARDVSWANQVVPGAYDQYFNRGSQYGNANSQVAGLFTNQPIMQPTYQASQTSPWTNAFDKYLNAV